MTKAYHEVANIFPLMSGDEYENLKADIAANGLREAIWLHPDGSIVDGRNRYRACMDLGLEPDYRTWDGSGSLVGFVVSLNLHRRHLDSNQKAAVAVGILPMLEDEVKEKERIRKTTFQKFEKSNMEPIHTTQQAAQMLGTNRQYVSDARKLNETEPELFSQVKTGKRTIPEAKQLSKLDTTDRQKVDEKIETGQAKNVKQAVKQIKKEKQIKAVNTTAIPDGKYHIIAIDPPWQYDNRTNDATHRAANPYPDMSLSEIKEYPIPELCHDDCILWLWTTNAFMKQAHEIAEYWGFEVKLF